MNVTSLPSLFCAALGLMLAPLWGPAAIAINFSSVNALGSEGTPAVDLAFVGATDWFALNASGVFGAPAIKDQKAGGIALAYGGSTGLFSAVNGACFNLTWSDGSATPAFDGPSGYFIFGSSDTQTFTAEIAAGATSTLSFFLNTAVDAQAKVTVRNGLGTRLLTQPLAPGYDLRSSLVITYTSTIADTLTFEFSLGPTGGQILGVAAVGLVSSESATLTAFESWRLLNFGTTATTGLSAVYAPEADADGDGLANLLEFALGGDPLVADPPPRRAF